MSTRRLLGLTLAILTLAALGWLAAGRPGTGSNAGAAGAAPTWSHPQVVDGDTLDATNPDGAIERIRILGINAPEWDACGGPEATAYLQELLAGADEIQLVRDPSQAARDKYDRVLAYVELPDGTDIGLELISDGYAREYTFDSPHQRAEAYEDAEDDVLVGC